MSPASTDSDAPTCRRRARGSLGRVLFARRFCLGSGPAPRNPNLRCPPPSRRSRSQPRLPISLIRPDCSWCTFLKSQRGARPKARVRASLAAEALTELLEGTGLTFQFLNERTVRIFESVVVAPTTQSTETRRADEAC